MDGRDYLALGREESLGAEVVLAREELFCAFLCRLWARERLFSTVQPLLAPGGVCPFDTQKRLALGSAATAAEHYLELLLGRGTRERCPQAGKYLQGVAREMQLQRQPYLCSALEGHGSLRPEESVLTALE